MISWHRFYDPTTGRYITPDPIGLDGGINLYAYVGGDPVNAVDPYGLYKITGDFIESPRYNHKDFDFQGWEFASPSWSWWGYLKFIRVFASESGFVNIDIRCTKTDECGNEEWEIHEEIPVNVSGSFEVGPNLYAIGAGLLAGPWVGIGTNVSIAGAVALQIEYDMLKKADEKAGYLIRLLLKYGPDAVCWGDNFLKSMKE